MKCLSGVFFALFALTAAQAQSSWMVDPGHSNIRFTVTHMMISEVDGEFKTFTGSVTSNSDDFSGASVEFTADVNSVNTGNERRDGHLKSDDFFNADKFPQIKFSGTIQKEGSDYYLVGDFTMRDVTKPVKFPVKYNGTISGGMGRKAGFKVMGTVNRFDYGLQWNRAMEAGGVVVGPDVEITCNVELNEKKEGSN